mmetsp:Transcript_77402/g.224582  ORF Transcript_77402/g.224582 Transcript_77402/m.224582 type:complete len:230 (+) Transcript_77402:447-1136(+)
MDHGHVDCQPRLCGMLPGDRLVDKAAQDLAEVLVDLLARASQPDLPEPPTLLLSVLGLQALHDVFPECVLAVGAATKCFQGEVDLVQVASRVARQRRCSPCSTADRPKELVVVISKDTERPCQCAQLFYGHRHAPRACMLHIITHSPCKSKVPDWARSQRPHALRQLLDGHVGDMEPKEPGCRHVQLGVHEARAVEGSHQAHQLLRREALAASDGHPRDRREEALLRKE